MFAVYDTMYEIAHSVGVGWHLIGNHAVDQVQSHAMELLDYLGVAERANHFPSTLSGGQQQRVAVARALANQPSIILADEPTAALDDRLGRQVMELFRKLAHEHGTGVVVVTHDHRALDVFDSVYEMEDGIIRRSEAETIRKTLDPVDDGCRETRAE